MARLLVLTLALCAVAVFGAVKKDNNRRITSTTTTTTPAPYKCKDAKFESYNTAKTCCLQDPGLFFKEAVIKECVKSSGGDVKYIKDYQLNKIQEPKQKNILNFNDEAITAPLYKPACLAQCLFTKISAYPSGAVDSAALATEIKANAPAAWSTPIDDAITACTDAVASFPKKFYDKKNNECDGEPLAWVQCLRWKLIGACPTDQEPTGPPKTVEACAVGTTAQEKCDLIFTTTTVAPAGR